MLVSDVCEAIEKHQVRRNGMVGDDNNQKLSLELVLNMFQQPSCSYSLGDDLMRVRALRSVLHREVSLRNARLVRHNSVVAPC